MRLEIRSLHFSYPRSEGGLHEVLRDVTVTVEDRSVHAVVGQSGCGKSTLLRLVAGLEKPFEGGVEFIGQRHHENLFAFVFQTPHLVPWWTVGRNVGIGAEFSGKPPEMYKKLTDFHTKQVGLGGLLNRLADTLSFGQQTRAGLGRAFAYDADVILLDEPFAHLDAFSRRQFYDEIETHWQLDPRTTVLVTNDVDEAVLLADRVSVMQHTPGPLVETIEVDVPRPRLGMSQAHARLSAATAQVWTALERGSSRL